MKKQYLVLLLSLMSQLSLAQAVFEYDAAGNRVKRMVTPYPDLVPGLQVSPGVTYGTTALTARLSVFEINGVPTSGPITVMLAKQSSVVFNFSQSTTTVAGTPVQNANWSFDNSNENFYIITSNAGIAGGALSIIGLTGTINPGGTSGTLSYTMVIAGGSGGEIKITNNVAATRMDYFP